MNQRFVEAIERVAETEGVDLVTFEKGQRKDNVAQKYLAEFTGEEGVLFIGKAQEKASVFRTDKRRDAAGKTYPWITRATAMPNHYYVYLVDRDFDAIVGERSQREATRREATRSNEVILPIVVDVAE